MGELLGPVLLDLDQCLKYKSRLTDFYYSNIKACSFMDSFSYRDAEQKIDGMIEHVSKGTAIVLGVFDKENLIGFIWAYENPFREEIRIYVNEIHVDALYRNLGVGKRLLSAVESIARERGYSAIYLHAEGSRENALHFYKREGYAVERVQFRKQL